MKSGLQTLLATFLFSALSANAASFSYTGNFQSPNDVQLITFDVTGYSTVTTRTWSYAGGVNANGTSINRGGFDPILTLFNASSGVLLNQNDDGGSLVSADIVSGLQLDSFLSSILNVGQYKVAITSSGNYAVGPTLTDGFQNTGTFDGLDSHWALDILLNPATPVPEADSWLMMLLGVGVIGALIRSRRNNPPIA